MRLRTIAECIEIGSDDLTVATNLQESRLLCGSEDAFKELKLKIHSDSFWPSETFYKAKIQNESVMLATRHHLQSRTGHQINTRWIKRHPHSELGSTSPFYFTSLLEMSKYGFLTDAEYRELVECQDFLWRVHFALHIELRR